MSHLPHNERQRMASEERRGNERGCDPLVSVPKALLHQGANGHAGKDAPKYKFNSGGKISPEILTMVFTGVIAFVAIVQACIFWYQWKAMKGQLSAMNGQLSEMQSGGKDTHELAVQAKNQADRTKEVADNALSQARATNRLANEAKRTANANQQSLAVARQSLDLLQRPWVGIKSISVRSNVEEGTDVPATVSLGNFGKMPARRLNSLVTMQTLCGPFPEHPSYGTQQDIGGTSFSVLMPDQVWETAEFKLSRKLQKSDMEALRKITNDTSTQCRLYVYGRVSYLDMLSNHRWRHFCGYWHVGTANTFSACLTYNDGDEDYPNGKEP